MANDEEPEALVLPSQQLPVRPFEPLPCNLQVPSPVPMVSSGVSTQESSLTPTETETTDRPLSEGEVLFTCGQPLPAGGNQLWKLDFELIFYSYKLFQSLKVTFHTFSDKTASINFQFIKIDKSLLFFFLLLNKTLLFIREKRFNLLFCHEINLENNWDLSC